jgi:hypothetical protein
VRAHAPIPLPAPVHEAWSRGRAWPGMSLPQLVYAVTVEKRRPPMPPGCPEGYASLMAQCWADSPRDRQAGRWQPSMRDMQLVVCL